MNKGFIGLTGSYLYHVGWMKAVSKVIHWVPDKYFTRVMSRVIHHSGMIARELDYMSKLSGSIGETYLKWSNEKIEELKRNL